MYSSLDFRSYRPAGLLVIDLVRHSTKPKAVGQRVRQMIDSRFAQALASLNIVDAHFNYTGDGYVCAFVGDASARVIDFINATIPSLASELAGYDQQFRAGLDFGLLHLKRNVLTGSLEHFDTPGINAARLQAVAAPNQILCTEVFRDIFAPLYPELFAVEACVVQTKDRQLRCYELIALDYEEIQQAFRDVLFRTSRRSPTVNNQPAILVVEDEVAILSAYDIWLQRDFPSCRLVIAPTAKIARQQFAPGVFGVVVMDIGLPDEDGMVLARDFLASDPEVGIVIASGHAVTEDLERLFGVGAMHYLQKPFEMVALSEIINLCITRDRSSLIQLRLRMIHDNVGAILFRLQVSSDQLQRILRSSDDNAAASLLRHKAKGLANDFVTRLKPSADIVGALDILIAQLTSLLRFARIVERAEAMQTQTYLEQVVRDHVRTRPKVQISFTSDLVDGRALHLSHGSLYALSVCELIDNAVAAVGAEGRVDICIQVLEATGTLYTCVSDSGPGIPAALRECLFVRGGTTKGDGRGLGLSLVRDAVTRLGGEVVYVADAVSAFTITIPLQDQPRVSKRGNSRQLLSNESEEG